MKQYQRLNLAIFLYICVIYYNFLKHDIYDWYYPYKSDKPNKEYYVFTNENKAVTLVRLLHLILHNLNHILIGPRIMKIERNPELIARDSGPAGYYGIYQQ